MKEYNASMCILSDVSEVQCLVALSILCNFECFLLQLVRGFVQGFSASWLSCTLHYASAVQHLPLNRFLTSSQRSYPNVQYPTSNAKGDHACHDWDVPHVCIPARDFGIIMLP
jgi:hypothetical protein